MPTKDPRSYVKTTPLPIPSQKGLKLQARRLDIYNPTSPTRAEVWKQNFDRRQQQMLEQGFSSYKHKPYKGVGDPFYLDEKKMILHSLGQWDENNEWDSSSSSEEDEDAQGKSTAAPQATMTAAKFVLRRTRKDLNTLPKEIVRGRGMIRNVRLGHGLFDLIKQDRLSKKAEAMAQKKKHLEAARNQWQPPKNSSSEEDTDDDLDRDDDLENYFGNVSGKEGTSEDEDGTMLSGYTRYGGDSSSASPRASSARKKKKKKQMSPRPFTPQHTNLSDVSDETEYFSKSSLFRQLCALNWILDAMNIEQGFSMGPISTCWSHLEIGGSKITLKRAREERRAESDWEKWMTNTHMGRIHKKASIARLSRPQRHTRLLAHSRVSVPSTSISPSSSSSQVNTIGHSMPSGLRESIPEEQAMGSPKESEDETLHRTGIFKFLDEYYDSLRREAQQEEERQLALTGVPVVRDESPSGPTTEQLELKRERRKERKAKKAKKLQEAEEFDSPETRNRSRYFLKDLRSSSEQKRPKSAAEIEFHATKPSNKYNSMRQDLHYKFKEIQDDKAMTLHDVLEQMDRERLTKCQNKFSNLRMHTMSFHRAVEQMRREGEKVVRPEDVRRQSSFKGNWYTDLLQNLPPEIKDIWYYRAVLQKLAKYGLVENTSKQSVYRFLKVLTSLRHWEICSPDICAAIEFCREKIVDMSVDEYELWFSQTFPTVARPKTAPPDVNKSQSSNNMPSEKPSAINASNNDSKNNPVITKSVDNNERLKVDSSDGRSNNVKSSLSQVSRSGAKSIVSIANGAEGKRRMVQSAAVGRKNR